MSNKAKTVLVRLGFSDKIVTKEEAEGTVTGEDSFLVGYEDEDGKECEENGTYLGN